MNMTQENNGGRTDGRTGGRVDGDRRRTVWQRLIHCQKNDDKQTGMVSMAYIVYSQVNTITASNSWTVMMTMMTTTRESISAQVLKGNALQLTRLI